MPDPTEYRTPVRDFARLVSAPAYVRGRLLLAAAVATGHETVRVLCGGPRFRVGLDVTMVELRERCPGTQYYEFDRQLDDDKACMVFTLEPGALPNLPPAAPPSARAAA